MFTKSAFSVVLDLHYVVLLLDVARLLLLEASYSISPIRLFSSPLLSSTVHARGPTRTYPPEPWVFHGGFGCERLSTCFDRARNLRFRALDLCQG